MNEKLKTALKVEKILSLHFRRAVSVFFENEIREWRNTTGRTEYQFVVSVKNYLISEGFIILNDSTNDSNVELRFADSKYGYSRSQKKLIFYNEELAKEFFEKSGLLE